MLNSNYNEKLLGLQGVSIKKCEKKDSFWEIELIQERKICICPHCGRQTDRIHDYRMQQRIKDLSSFGNRMICQYFKGYDRSHVKYFVSDMYKPYAEIAETYFPNATYVIDRYHWIRQVLWAFEAVRKDVQKRFNKQHRIYFKHSKGILSSNTRKT